MLLSPETLLGYGDITITLPSLSPQTFERFDLYGPFVRSLTISKRWKNRENRSSAFTLQGWPTLVQRVQLGTLLPNLLELNFFGEFGSSDEILLWMSSFVSPSLRTLDIRTPDRIVPLPDAVAALATLAQKCPELRILGHNFKLRDATSASSDRGAVLQMMLLPTACNHLQSFQRLSCLWILGNFVNSESLVAISQLPHLRTLGIDQILDRNSDLPRILKSTRLSNNSFPALSELCISFNSPDDILAIWETEQLVQNLGEVHLKRTLGTANRFSIPQEDVLARILSTICKRSPHTKRLTLEGASLKNPRSSSPESTWAYLTQLPLSYLKLVGLGNPFISVLPVLPELLALDLLNQRLQSNDLIHLSRFPKLEKLSANLAHLGPLPEVRSNSMAPLRTIKIHCPLTDRLEIKSADKVAR
ncbi:hypothetical protein FRC08_018923 [Ceratobasidium sp. 394]|nr:hypothetical protein FRC08_018923 [Ceratobasidium sp. 394]